MATELAGDRSSREASGGSSAGIAAAVAPDETAYDLLRALRSCRSTGLPCVDAHLPGGLGPSELVVLHGEAGSAKSALLHNIIVEYVAPPALGGHGLPAILIDADGAFDVGRLAALLEARAARRAPQDVFPSERMAKLVKEALSRLLVLCPDEPLDLLGHLRQVREVLGANPAASLLAVDAMTAWQPLSAAFSRAVAPVLRECWAALARLQRELCVAVLVVQRDLGVDGLGGSAYAGAEGVANACRLSVMRRAAGAPGPEGPRGEAGREVFLVSSRARGPEAPVPAAFAFSEAGEVVTVQC